MADEIFSAARLRGYRVLEEEGLGSAPDLLILNTIASARLWLPLSLIEVAFRNAVDAVVTEAHPAREVWLCAASLEDLESLDWGRIEGRAVFRRQTVAVKEDGGASDPSLAFDDEGDGDDSPEDPVSLAARMASRHGRPIVTRNDVVAHLMLGFWVFRAPSGLLNEVPAIDVYELLRARFDERLGSAKAFRNLMAGDILLTRNRVAHQEPVLIRARYIFDRKTGTARGGNDLVTSLIAAVEKFRRLATLITETARVMAPMANEHLDAVLRDIESDLEPLSAALQHRFDELKKLRDERRSARRAANQSGA